MKTPLKSQIIPVAQKSKNLFYALYKKQTLNTNEYENKNVEEDITANIKYKIAKVAMAILT